MLHYCILDGYGFFRVADYKKGDSFSVHIYVNNKKILDIKYQASNVFWIDLKQLITNDNDMVKIRHFTKSGAERKIDTENIGRVKSKSILKNLTNTIVDKLTPNEFKHYISYLLLNKQLYQMLSSTSKINLIKNKNIIVNEINKLTSSDKNFLIGVYYYRVSNFEKSKIYFNKTKDVQNSYDNVGKAVFLYDHLIKKPLFPNFIYFQETQNKDLIVLISCDVGYLFAYKDNLILSLSHHSQLIHVHVLVKNKTSINKVKSEFKEHAERIKLSFEFLTNQDKKVYSSISRFILAKKIMSRYGRPILIVDIDINFSFNCVETLINLKLDKIGLFINQNQLPWKKILAGFCYFPNNENSYIFLESLSRYLVNICEENNYYWTIDQIALTNMYDSKILNDCDFINFRECKTIRLKQVEERQAARKFAQQFKDH